jgi:hypothetical protein
MIRRDLMAQASRAGVNQDYHLIWVEAESLGGGMKDFFHAVNFHKMVTRPERAQLVNAPLFRMLGNRFRTRVPQAT